MSRYVFTSGLSCLEHKKSCRQLTPHQLHLMGISTASAHAASTARQLSTIYLCNVLGVNASGETYWVL
jgi:hypothetical protein